jgi:SAM-dependent methyltransferase
LSASGAIAEYAGDAYHPDWLESSYRELRAVFGQRMPELAESVGPRARVLEIGSFVGGFLAAAQDYGWQARGIDVGDCVTRFARSKGLDVQTGVLADAGFKPRSFDAVFVWFCFEQLHQPWQDLEEIHRILNDGGRLFVRVPNGAFVRWMHGVQGHAPFAAMRENAEKCLAVSGLAAFPFQVGYTPASLRRILRESGFDSVKVRNQINLRGSDRNRPSFWNVPAANRTLRFVHAEASSCTMRRSGPSRRVHGSKPLA